MADLLNRVNSTNQFAKMDTVFTQMDSVFTPMEPVFTTTGSVFTQMKPVFNTPTSTPSTSGLKKPSGDDIVQARINDPYQINTILDVLFNEAALQANYGDTSFKSRIKAIQDMVKYQYWNPIKQGEWGTVGLNTLLGFGEVVDVFANPVKAIFAPSIDKTADIDYDTAVQVVAAVTDGHAIEYTTSDGTNAYRVLVNGAYVDVPVKDYSYYEWVVNSGRTVKLSDLSLTERLKASVGIGEYGRINFEYNTGNRFADFLLEVVSDPTTWISFGTSSAFKTMTSQVDNAGAAIAKQLDDIVKVSQNDRALLELSKTLADDVYRKRLSKEAASILRKGTIEFANVQDSTMRAYLTSIADKLLKPTTAGNVYAAQDLGDVFKYLLVRNQDLTYSTLSSKQVLDVIQRAETAFVNTKTYNVLKGLDKAQMVTDSVQRVLIKSALTPSGAYPIYKAAKVAGPKVLDFIHNTFKSADELYTNPNGLRPIMSLSDDVNNVQRSAQTVYDAVPDADVKVLINAPDRINAVEQQLVEDLNFFKRWVKEASKGDYANKLNELAEHLRVYQRVDNVEQLLQAVDSTLQNPAYRTEVIQNYRSVVAELGVAVERIQQYANLDNVVKTLDTTKTMPESAVGVVTKLLDVSEQTPAKFISDSTAFTTNLQKVVEAVGVYDTVAAEELSTFVQQYKTLFDKIAVDLTTVDDAFEAAVDYTTYLQDIFKFDDPVYQSYLKELSQINMQFNVAVSNITNAVKAQLQNTALVHNIDNSLEVIRAAQQAYNKQYNKLYDAMTRVSKGYEDKQTAVYAAKQYAAAQELVESAVRGIKNGADEALSERLKVLLELDNDAANIGMLDAFIASTPGTSDYDDVLYYIQRTLQNAISRQDYGAQTTAFDIYDARIMEMFNNISSDALESTKASLSVYEDIAHMKAESFYTAVQLLEEEPVQRMMEACSSGRFYNLMQNVIDGTVTIGANSGMSSDVIKEFAKSGMNAINNFNAFKDFVSKVQLSALSADAKAGLFAAVMNYWRVKPTDFLSKLDYWTQNILRSAEDYINYTQHANKSYALDALLRDGEYQERIAEMFASVGRNLPESEAHTVLDDTLIDAGVFMKLAETDEALAKTVRDNIVVVLDTETMNISTAATKNMVHQIGFTVLQDGKVIDQYSVGLGTAGLIRDGVSYLPERGYLEKLYKADFPDVDVTALDIATLNDNYISRLAKSSSTVVNDESSLLQQFITEYNDRVQQLCKVDAVTGKPNVVLAHHNGYNFDMPLLMNKLNQRGINTVVPTTFFTGAESIDTLKLLHKNAGFFEMSSAERAAIGNMLWNYADSIKASNKMFTVIDYSTLTDLQSFIRLCTSDRYLAGNADFMRLLNDISYQINAAAGALYDIQRVNSMYADMLLKGSDLSNTDYWVYILKRMGYSDDDITKRFGVNGANLTWSSLFGAAGDYQTVAYRWDIRPQIIDRWFMDTASRVEKGTVSYSDAMSMTTIGKTLDKIAAQVPLNSLYAIPPVYTKSATEALLDATSIPSLRYLRTDDLNIQQQWAIMKYLANKHRGAEDELYSILFKDVDPTHLDEAEQSLYSLLTSDWVDNPDFGTSLRYADSLVGKRSYVDGNRYLQALDRLTAVQTTFDEMSRTTDQLGMVGGAAGIYARAFQPCVDAIRTYYDYISNLSREYRASFFEAERALVDNYAVRIMREFVSNDADSTVQWLAHSHGFVVFNKADFGNVMSADGYSAFIKKLGSSEFFDKGVRVIEANELTWVYLSKDSGYRVLINSDNSAHVLVNNIEIPRYEWGLWDIDDLHKVYKAKDGMQLDLTATLNALDNVTEGAVRGSLGDTFSRGQLDELYKRMPTDMLTDFYTNDYLSTPGFWTRLDFNHTILGTSAARNELGAFSSNSMFNNIVNATEFKMNDRGVRLVYVQAMMNDAGCVKGTAMADIMTNDPVAASKWFKNNPDYTAAALIKDTRAADGFRLIEVDMTTPAGVKKALDLNAKIVSYSEFNKLYEVINDNIFAESSLRGWQTILRQYKIGYLVNPGTWVRNAVDAFMKNLQSTGDNFPTLVKHYGQAMKMLSDYDNYVIKLKELGNGTFPNSIVMREFFEGTSMDYEEFMLLHRFMADPAAGGEAAVYTKANAAARKRYLEQLKDAGQITTEAFERQSRLLSYNQFTSMMLNPMNYVERVSRLAEFMSFVDKGESTTTALRLVEKTHFAYNVKTPVEQTLELFVPFYTFASRNFNYWMEALDKNPSYFALLGDFLDAGINMQQYSINEQEDNDSVLRNVMSGNISITADWSINLSLSFMDALQWLTDPVAQAKSQVFSPVQSVLNVWLQGASDEAYHSGAVALSNWFQNTFGTNPTEQQIRDKYGEWADEYMKLYSSKVSSEDPLQILADEVISWQLIPLIGTQIQRMQRTGMYMDDEQGLMSVLYLAGLAGRVYRWEDQPYSAEVNKAIGDLIANDETARYAYSNIRKMLGYEGVSLADIPYAVKQKIFALISDPNTVKLYVNDDYVSWGSRIYDMMQDDEQNVYLYAQLKRAMGYGDTSLGDLPDDVKATIGQIMSGITPTQTIVPVLQDQDAMRYLWNSVCNKYGFDVDDFEVIPAQTLNQMYFEVAKASKKASEIYDMLENDESTRYSYAVAKNKLGLGDLKSYQLPLEALDVIEYAMRNKTYAVSSTAPLRRTNYNYRRRSYVPSGRDNLKGVSGATPYNTRQGVYANYGHNYATKQNKRPKIYDKNYTSSGKSRMELRMLKISPENLNYRLKDMFYYYK